MWENIDIINSNWMFASKVVNQTGIAVLCPLKLLTHFFKRGVRAVYFVLWAAYLCFELVWKLEKKKNTPKIAFGFDKQTLLVKYMSSIQLNRWKSNHTIMTQYTMSVNQKNVNLLCWQKGLTVFMSFIWFLESHKKYILYLFSYVIT